ncbi:hypothetical protein V6Z11_A11G346500 [Gossypium hirsutum]
MIVDSVFGREPGFYNAQQSPMEWKTLLKLSTICKIIQNSTQNLKKKKRNHLPIFIKHAINLQPIPGLNVSIVIQFNNLVMVFLHIQHSSKKSQVDLCYGRYVGGTPDLANETSCSTIGNNSVKTLEWTNINSRSSPNR